MVEPTPCPSLTDPQLRLLLEAAPIAMLVFNDRLEVIAANPSARRLFALPPESRPPWTCTAILGCAAQDTDSAWTCPACSLMPGMRALLAETTATEDRQGEMRVERDPSHGPLWLRYHLRPVALDSRRAMLVTLFDITSLRHSEQQHAMLFREMFNAFALHEIIVDAQGRPIDYRYLAVNPAFERMTGLSAEQVVGNTVLAVLPDTEARWIEVFGQVALTGEPARFEEYSRALDKHFAISAFSPTPGQFACLFEDITVRKQTEQRLLDSEGRLRALTDAAKDGIVMMDEQGRITFWNPAAEAMFGYRRDEAIGVNLHRLLASPRFYAEFARTFPAFQQTGQGRAIGATLELMARRRDHGEIPIELSLAAVRRGQSWHTVGILRDITERKRAEAQVRQNEARLRKLVEILQHPADSASALLDFALEQAVELTGSQVGYIFRYTETSGELQQAALTNAVEQGCTVSAYPTRFHLERTGLWGEAVRQRRPIVINDFQSPHPLKRGLPEGHLALHRFASIPVFHDERITFVVGLANKESDYDETDILQVSLLMEAVGHATERKEMEEERARLQAQLAQAQKMEAIGTLAGGIAHDFNNILGAILGYAEMARDSSHRGGPVIRELDKVLEAGNRAAALVRQILAFSRQGESQRAPINPAPIVKEVVKLLRPSLPSTIAIRQHIESTRAVLANPTQLHQILMNLCTNAYHAMEASGGSLEITLTETSLAPAELGNRPWVRPGRAVVLTVTDTGSGIPPEVQQRMFEPYFTTKETGKGTGMGLAIVHGIVCEYGGFIAWDSQPGVGTSFRVHLPTVAEEVRPAPAGEPSVPITGQGRILLVDDEAMLAEMGRDMLEMLGYEVTVCTDSAEALAVFSTNPARFDAVVTDQTMPGLTGIELCRRMLQLRPDLPILLCTGFSNLVDEAQAKAAGIRGFAMKPLALKDLAALLRATMASPEA